MGEFCRIFFWILSTLLDADDLALIVDTQEECISMLNAWKAGMENKGLRVNMKKTKFLVPVFTMMSRNLASVPVLSALVVSVRNSTLCSQCIMLVHRPCSGITKWLVEDPNYICPRFKGESRPIDGWTVAEVDVDGTMLDAEATSCYLSDMLWPCHCCLVLCGLRKVRETLACSYHQTHIHPAYVSRCARPAFAQLRSMAAKCGDQRNPNFGGSDAMTVPWSVGSVASKTETKNSASILLKLGIKDITSLLRCQRHKWYGHVQRDTPCRAAVRHSLVLPTPLNGTRTWPQYKMDMGGRMECWPCWRILLIIAHVYYENCEPFTIKWHLHSPPPLPHSQHLEYKKSWFISFTSQTERTGF